MTEITTVQDLTSLYKILYGDDKEINEIILEKNEVELESVISGQSQDKNETNTKVVGAISNSTELAEPEFLSAAEAVRLQAPGL